MAETHRTVAVKVETVATEPGLWCRRCMLPSGVLVYLAVSLGDRMHLQQMRKCRDCGSGAHVTFSQD